LVEKQVELLMMPLVEQLVQRTTFVMSRVPIVVDNVLGAKGSLASQLDKVRKYAFTMVTNLFS
jgi:hypothetical protein